MSVGIGDVGRGRGDEWLESMKQCLVMCWLFGKRAVAGR